MLRLPTFYNANSFHYSGVTITHTFYKTVKIVLNDHSVGTLDQVIHFAAMIIHKVLRYTDPFDRVTIECSIKTSVTQVNFSLPGRTADAADNREVFLSQ